MARSYTPTAMYRYGAMQKAGGAGVRPYGPELLDDPNFLLDATPGSPGIPGWSVSEGTPGNCFISGGVFECTGSNISNYGEQDRSDLVQGTSYRVVINVVSLAGGATAAVSWGSGVLFTPTTNIGETIFDITMPANGEDVLLYVYSGSGIGTVVMTSLSIKEIL